MKIQRSKIWSWPHIQNTWSTILTCTYEVGHTDLVLWEPTRICLGHVLMKYLSVCPINMPYMIGIMTRWCVLYKNHDTRLASMKVKVTLHTYILCIGCNEACSCLALKFVQYGGIPKLYDRNDHHDIWYSSFKNHVLSLKVVVTVHILTMWIYWKYVCIIFVSGLTAK